MWVSIQVYDVFLHIIPKPKPVDVHSEADPTGRLMEYLRAVKYKPGTDAMSFRLALANCSRDTIYSLLKWVLSQVPVLRQRATIGFYLTIPEVPAEYRGIQVSTLWDITLMCMAVFRQKLSQAAAGHHQSDSRDPKCPVRVQDNSPIRRGRKSEYAVTRGAAQSNPTEGERAGFT